MSEDGLSIRPRVSGCTRLTVLLGSMEPTTGKRTSRSSLCRDSAGTLVCFTLLFQKTTRITILFAAASVLSNGSVLVIGGETGSNASPEANLEILPKPAGGDTVIDLDWLARTDPYNLYPFVFTLPSGNIFVSKSLLLL